MKRRVWSRGTQEAKTQEEGASIRRERGRQSITTTREARGTHPPKDSRTRKPAMSKDVKKSIKMIVVFNNNYMGI